MKKKYALSIFSISIIMLISIGIYGARFLEKNDINLSEIILNNLYNIDASQTNEEKQDNMETNLSQSSYINANVSRDAIVTNTGYEGLNLYAEKKCYNLIKANAYKISDTELKPGLYSIEPISITGYRLNSTQIKKVLYAIQNDNPDIFWIGSSFSYCYSGNKTILKLNSVFSKENLIIAIKKLNDKVKEILSKAPKNVNDYEMELFFHDYIVENCKYKNIGSTRNADLKVFTSYGCLVENSAVCEGFSKSMQLLMNSVGIKCRTVVGARGSEPHMWNIVKINGNWYHIDVTWDGASGFQKYNYFNLTDEAIKKDHKINEELRTTTKFDENVRYNFKMPVCSSKNDNYYEKNAVKISNLDLQAENAITQGLIKASSSKKEYFYIKMDNTLPLETAKKQLVLQKPYKFFSCVNKANQSLKKGSKINNQQVQYSENAQQNVLIIKLSYK